jgi:uncharacterized repeat protein (TIGR04052 family)
MFRSVSRAGGLATLVIASVYAVVACSDSDKASPSTSAPTDAGPTDTGTTEPATDASPDTGSPVKTMPVTIKFKAKVGTQEFKCNQSYENIGSTNETVEPKDLRFFVQDVKLIDSNGSEVPVVLDTRSPWQTPAVALLDFEDGTGECTNGNPELNDQVTGTVPEGTYNGIVFTNGVPENLNHVDPATETAPLSAGNMTWGWLLGHLFVKLEMVSTATPNGIGLLHLGSVGCVNNLGDGGDDFAQGPTAPCTQPNRNLVKLTGFNPASSAVVLDAKTIFAETDLSAESTCHSGGPVCPSLFSSVGLTFADGARLPTAPAFRVE